MNLNSKFDPVKYDKLSNWSLRKEREENSWRTWVFVGEISMAGWNRKMFVVEHSYLP